MNKRKVGLWAMALLPIALLSALIGQASAGAEAHPQARPLALISTADEAVEKQFGVQATASRRHSRQHVRTGKIVDHDTTLADGNFNFATGHARCKRHERLVSGGIRTISSAGLIPGLRWAVQESGPIPSRREWSVLAASDLGGLGRQDFIVIAVCERKR